MIVLVWLVGCAEEQAPVVTPKAEPTEAPDVPTYCAPKTKPCVPPQDFVERLCVARYSSVAPYLFQKHTPFLRLHAKSRSIELKNAFNGPVGAEPVAFAEEVLLLRASSASTNTSKKRAEEFYDVLRWDGTCASIAKRDLATYLPGVPQAAPIAFDTLDTTMRAALVRDAKIAKLSQVRTAACQQKESSPDCRQADKLLSDAVVAAIRQGLRLPMPRHRPASSEAAEGVTPANSRETRESEPSRTGAQ